MGEFPQRFGKYLLLRRVALGGMAEIFLALERTAHAGHRFVTIKRIKPEFEHDSDYVEFFLTEGRVSLKCAHPNLPQTFDLAIEGNTPYLAMEYIHGHTLLDVVRAAALGKKPLSLATTLGVGLGLAGALEHAHGLIDVDGQPLRVVHRDVTPQNVMLSASGAVKLIDFGIVRSAMQTHHTQSGVVKGKFSYMAPEMLVQKGPIDHRADLFALGIVLHETLTGRSLFRGASDHETLDRVRNLAIPDLSQVRHDVPPGFTAVVVRLLERDPARRYQSATEVLDALERVAESHHLHHSVTRLRDEVLERCGDPPRPTVDQDALRLLLEPRPGSAPPVADDLHPRLATHEFRLDVVDDEPPTYRVGVSGRPRSAPDAWTDAVSDSVSDAEIPLSLADSAVIVSDDAEIEDEAEIGGGSLTDAAAQPSALDRDPELVYYLRRSGGLPHHTRSDAITHSDPELAALLATLDR